MKNYNCFTCQEPMKVSIFFHTYIRQNGPQQQKCTTCGAIHDIDEKNNIRLVSPGVQVARLSEVFPFPQYVPHRVGQYRVRWSTYNWSKTYLNWDGEKFHNGPIVFSHGAIIAWQGLAGDMEHLKKIPGPLIDAISDIDDYLPPAS